MYELSEREQRFARAFGWWWQGVVNHVFLRAAHYVLPRKAQYKLAIFFYDTAESVGEFVGAIYFCASHFGDVVRWLFK